MSVVHTVDIFCDGDSVERGCSVWSGQTNGVGMRADGTYTAGSIRSALRRQGWVRRDGRDLCPFHAELEAPDA